MKYRLLICGDRDWTDADLIKECILKLGVECIECIIEGEARGADKMAGDVAEELGVFVLKFPADWDKYKKAAGPIRNTQMLKEGKPTLVWAFHDDLHNSKGTANMVRQSLKAGIDVKSISHNGIKTLSLEEAKQWQTKTC